jgi:hypothetical protein
MDAVAAAVAAAAALETSRHDEAEDVDDALGPPPSSQAVSTTSGRRRRTKRRSHGPTEPVKPGPPPADFNVEPYRELSFEDTSKTDQELFKELRNPEVTDLNRPNSPSTMGNVAVPPRLGRAGYQTPSPQPPPSPAARDDAAVDAPSPVASPQKPPTGASPAKGTGSSSFRSALMQALRGDQVGAPPPPQPQLAYPQQQPPQPAYPPPPMQPWMPPPPPSSQYVPYVPPYPGPLPPRPPSFVYHPPSPAPRPYVPPTADERGEIERLRAELAQTRQQLQMPAGRHQPPWATGPPQMQQPLPPQSQPSQDAVQNAWALRMQQLAAENEALRAQLADASGHGAGTALGTVVGPRAGAPVVTAQQLEKVSPEERRMRQGFLHDLDRVVSEGAKLTRTFTMADSSYDMQFELQRIYMNRIAVSSKQKLRSWLTLIFITIQVANGACGEFLKLGSDWATQQYNNMHLYESGIDAVWRRWMKKGRSTSSDIFDIFTTLLTSLLVTHATNTWGEGAAALGKLAFGINVPTPTQAAAVQAPPPPGPAFVPPPQPPPAPAPPSMPPASAPHRYATVPQALRPIDANGVVHPMASEAAVPHELPSQFSFAPPMAASFHHGDATDARPEPPSPPLPLPPQEAPATPMRRPIDPPSFAMY